jgi:hypothetical protein
VLVLALFVIEHDARRGVGDTHAEAWVQAVIRDSGDFEVGAPWKLPEEWRRRDQCIPNYFAKSLKNGNVKRVALAAALFDGAGTTVEPLPVSQIKTYLQLLLRGEKLLGVGLGTTTTKNGAVLRRTYVIPQVALLIRSHRDRLIEALRSSALSLALAERAQTTRQPSEVLLQRRRFQDVTNMRDSLSTELAGLVVRTLLASPRSYSGSSINSGNCAGASKNTESPLNYLTGPQKLIFLHPNLILYFI